MEVVGAVPEPLLARSVGLRCSAPHFKFRNQNISAMLITAAGTTCTIHSRSGPCVGCPPESRGLCPQKELKENSPL